MPVSNIMDMTLESLDFYYCLKDMTEVRFPNNLLVPTYLIFSLSLTNFNFDFLFYLLINYIDIFIIIYSYISRIASAISHTQPSARQVF